MRTRFVSRCGAAAFGAALAAALLLAPGLAPGIAAQQGGQKPTGPVRVCDQLRDYQAFYKCATDAIKNKPYNPPKTKDGKPDFNGIWGPTRIAQDIEQVKPGQYGPGGGGMNTLIVDPPDGKIPYAPWAQQPRRDAEQKWVSPTALCLPVGAQRWSYSPVSVTGHRFTQQPHQIIVSMERLHTYRIIRMTNDRKLDPSVKLWEGDSRGRWEGNTLVVDTQNLNDLVWFDHIGTFSSDEMKMEERMTLVDANTMLYVASYNDPKVFSQPWKLSLAFTRGATKGLDAIDLEDTTIEGCDNTIQHMFNVGQRPWTGLGLVLPNKR